ncbi:PepSY domain-containing protein [Peribacillus sp. SCS-155]|uniref:PepSY domain-containing protein n=1 Tax=Peribacillus sedimenti TaxID=3115297 RepID=UPI003906B7F9
MMKKLHLFGASCVGFILASNLAIHTTFAEKVAPNEISEEQAKSIALQQAKGKIVSVTSEMDDGIAKYEVMVQGSDGMYEVEIAKSDGRVLEVEKESGQGMDNQEDDDDDDDDRHDDDRYDD